MLKNKFQGNIETIEEDSEVKNSTNPVTNVAKPAASQPLFSVTTGLKDLIFRGDDALPHLLDISEKVVEKCDSCLALGESILNELESQLMRTDHLKTMLDTIQEYMLETQLFLLNVKQPFYKRVLPCFAHKKMSVRSPQHWSSQMMLQAEKEMELSISVKQRFGNGTSNDDAEFDWSAMLDQSPTSKTIIQNLTTASEKLRVVKEMSLSIMLELLLQIVGFLNVVRLSSFGKSAVSCAVVTRGPGRNTVIAT
ncbi:hypothetical protein HELRODRAFT_163262 [Helobdella robusta]|uniref:Uncharacterized protein n=1 Tax=Helobdella robusta TaxID=6412 RepID=T1ETU8_HELRO|nr:hypothetical protein HELRODRAFT_163262 [Helobdella robusta]ESN96219.1 hypothetical protein HELRODRAFT_163262 [Helobdella robusta]